LLLAGAVAGWIGECPSLMRIFAVLDAPENRGRLQRYLHVKLRCLAPYLVAVLILIGSHLPHRACFIKNDVRPVHTADLATAAAGQQCKDERILTPLRHGRRGQPAHELNEFGGLKHAPARFVLNELAANLVLLAVAAKWIARRYSAELMIVDRVIPS